MKIWAWLEDNVWLHIVLFLLVGLGASSLGLIWLPFYYIAKAMR